jgi:hypothetical protein
MTAHWRTSRFAPGELTFGAVGRVVATILFLSPILFALDLAGVIGIFFALPYLTMVVPQGLRWLWQPAPVEFIVDPVPAAPLQPDPPPPDGGIAGRQAPGRW